MILLNANVGITKLPSVLLAVIILFIGWRIVVAIARASTNSASDTQANKRKNRGLQRRDIIRFFELINLPSIRYNPQESKNLLWAGINNSFAGDSYITGASLGVAVIGIGFAIVKWLWSGWRTEFPLNTLFVFLLIALTIVLGYVLLYSIAFIILKDFRFLLEAQLLRGTLDYKASKVALQKAISIHPSEFAFTQLGNVQREIISRESVGGSGVLHAPDYSICHQYFDEAIRLDKYETTPYLAKANLYKYTKDYASALNSYHELHELETKLKSSNGYTIGDFSLAEIYRKWGEDLLIAGEYHEAITKLDLAEESFLKEDSLIETQWAYWDRSRAYLALGEFEKAKEDFFLAFRSSVKFFEAILKSNYPRKIWPQIFEQRWPQAFDELIDYAFTVFKALENQDGAITFLTENCQNKSTFYFPICAKRLIMLLIEGGKADEAEALFLEYKDYLQGDIGVINKRFTAFPGFRSKSEIEEAINKQYNDRMLVAYSIVESATVAGYFDLARKYIITLEGDSEYRATLCEQMGKLLEREWKYKEALNYYVELFQIRDEKVTDELTIAQIKSCQRDFHQAIDAYEGYFSALEQIEAPPPQKHIVGYAYVKEQLNDYVGAMDILSCESRKYSSPCVELRRKEDVKRQILRY